MGREVRMVPEDWVHPKDFNTFGNELRLKPQHEGNFAGGYETLAAEWDEAWQKWQEGYYDAYESDEKWSRKPDEYADKTYTWYAGRRPSPDDWMPVWPPEMKTHYMMYQNTSEGTPISPAFATPEELAHWLADNNASTFADMTATYEQWLSIVKTRKNPAA